MRVELKHVHTVHKVLADGSVATYHYAWRGGPRLRGEPGSAEFLRSWEAARGEQHTPDQSQLRSILTAVAWIRTIPANTWALRALEAT